MACRCTAVDGVVVEKGNILLIKREKEPFKGHWVLPGGFVEDETVEEAVVREVAEETGLKAKVDALVGVFSHPSRDPRGVISVAFLCRVVGGALRPSEEGRAQWFSLDELPRPIGFDHLKIIEKAVGLYKDKKEGGR